MDNSSLLRAVLLAWVGLSPLLVSGCGDDEPSGLVNCEAGAPEEWDSCYDYSDKSVHCASEVLRKQYTAGRYKRDQLPDWAITRSRDGGPIIYDVRADEAPFLPGDATGRLITWSEQTKGVSAIDGDAVDGCALSMTEGEMREAVGGGEGTTEWS